MRHWGMSGVVFLAWMTLAQAEEPNQGIASNRVGLINIGGFDEPLFGRIADHVARHLRTTPKVLAPQDAAGSATIESETSALSPLVTGEVVCVVGVAVLPESTKMLGAIDPVAKTAMVNASGMRPAAYDEEAYGRRLEKEVIRCIGRLMGMEDCLNPFCALHTVANKRQLDQKGRNYCPPCSMHWKAKRDGSRLDRRRGSDVVPERDLSLPADQ